MTNIFKRINRATFLRNAIILSFTLAIFLALDQFTKLGLFAAISPKEIDVNGQIPGQQPATSGLFGTRLITNTGMFSSLGAGTVPYWGVQTITSLVFIILINASLLSRKWLTSLGFALMAAGALGNIFDRFLLTYTDAHGNVHHYVRDWIYHPSFNRGTYNIADVEVVVGSMITAISILWGLFKSEDDEKTSKIKKEKTKTEEKELKATNKSKETTKKTNKQLKNSN